MSDAPRQQQGEAADRGEFIRVRFAGGRFDSHTIPFDMLPDLAAYRELIVDVAKHLFFERHQGRKRVPKGFTESFQLGLAGVISGNSATALAHRLELAEVTAQPALEFATAHGEFEDARDLVDQVILRASQGLPLPDQFPPALTTRFNRFGQGLRGGEFMELSHGSSAPLRYDSRARKQIVLSANPTYEDLVDDKFVLDGGKDHKRLLHLIDRHGNTFDLPASDEDFEKAMSRRRHSARIVGIGQFNKLDRLTRILSYSEIIHTDDEPQQEFNLRLDDIARTPSGWYSADNPAPSPKAIELMRRFIAVAVPEAAIPYPYIYPMPEGGIRAEWSRGDWEISATISGERLIADLHALNIESDQEIERELDTTAADMLSEFIGFWSQIESGNGRSDE